ncbi:hypothetical protein MKX01_022348 [Papaver californicum]|nr:hypothetical protein MKX01_022348 [Papaver californicum]
MMMGTGDEVGGGGGGGGGPGNFLFENQTWASVFSSINSDNSCGLCSTEELHKTTTCTSNKLIDSTSTSPTLTPTPTPTPTPTTVTPPELVVSVVGQTTSTSHQKRSRGGAKSSTGKGTSCAGGDWNECKVGGESDHEIHIWTERERRKKMRNMFSTLHALLPQLPAKADKSTIVDEAVNYIKTLQHSLQKLQKQRLEMLRGGVGGGPTLTTPTIIDYEPSSSSLVVASNSPTLNSREAFLADQAGPSSASMNNNSSSSMITDNMTFSSSAPNNSLSVVPCINSIPSTFQTWSSPNVVLSVNGDDAQISVCAAKKPGILTSCCYVLEKHKLEVVTAHVSSDYYRSMFMIHAHVSSHYMLLSLSFISRFLFFCR